MTTGVNVGAIDGSGVIVGIGLLIICPKKFLIRCQKGTSDSIGSSTTSASIMRVGVGDIDDGEPVEPVGVTVNVGVIVGVAEGVDVGVGDIDGTPVSVTTGIIVGEIVSISINVGVDVGSILFFLNKLKNL